MPEPEEITAAPAAETAEEQATPPGLEPWEEEMEKWFQDVRLNLAHLGTDVHNYLFTAKEELKARLRGFTA